MTTVVHVLGNFGPGGAEMGVVRLVQGLDQTKGFEHVIVSIGSDLRMQPLLPPGAACLSLGLDSGSKTAFWKLQQLFKRYKADLVLVNNLAPWFDAALASRLAGCPCVEIFHGVESSQLDFSLTRKFLFHLARSLSRKVVAVSDPARIKLEDLTGIMSDRVVLNGVDTEYFRPIALGEQPVLTRQDLGLSDKQFVFGCVAGLRGVKNHQGLLQAFARLVSKQELQDADPVLVLVGQGPLDSELKQQAEALGIARRIFFLGQREDVRDVMRLLDVFVLNSDTEGLSYAVLEAMSCALPVLLTAVGSNSELVGQRGIGILVPPQNEDLLVQGMASLIKRRDCLAEMGRRARQVVVKEYSLAKMLDNYQDLFSTLCGRGKF